MYNPRKDHIYQKMIRKCKFHMGHNPWNMYPFEKNVLGRETVPHKVNHQHNTTKIQKLKKVESTCRESLTPQRTSTYDRPLPMRVTIMLLFVQELFFPKNMKIEGKSQERSIAYVAYQCRLSILFSTIKMQS